MAVGTVQSTRMNSASRLVGILGLAAALAVAAVLASSAAAHAERPVDLGGAYVLDSAGALGASTSRVESALDALFDATGAPLFVVVVDSFEGAIDAAAWADETASLSGLGDRDALLAIAIDDREYATSVGVEFPATDAQLEAAVTDALIPALRDNRWADGIIAYADALRGDSGGSPGAESGGGIPILPIALGVGGVGAAWFFISRARRKKNPVIAAVESQSIAELDQTASRRLVQLDDALATSEQELGFAEAQFGSVATAGFRTALTEARALVTDAFRTRRELDDENAKTDEQKRADLLSIVAACEKADELLEAQEEAFDALRDVERDHMGRVDFCFGFRQRIGVHVPQGNLTAFGH
ncbi:MAG: TPM domain-containing protein, partial [Microcella sp.]|nr:TPM domain-containing protein [Microcella sp.]